MAAKHLIAVYLCAGLLSACGGGGDGGGNTIAANDGSAQYTGNRNAASINSGNAATLATKALDGSDDAESGASTATRTAARGTGAFAIARTAILKQMRNNAAREVIIDEGGCGGSVTENVEGSDRSFYGSAVFNNYCEGVPGQTVTISGTIQFSGTADEFGDLLTFSLSFVNFTVVEEPAETTVMSGTVAFTMNGPEEDMTISAAVTDSSGATYWLVNYRIDDNGSGGVSISGQFYHPDHGHVTVTTITPFTGSGEWPSSGVLVISGAGGSKAQLTASTSGYQVDIDANGDGFYETIGTVQPWPAR